MILPEHDSFQPRSDDPFWNEVGWFSFMVPERQLSGFVYFYHRPNMRYSVGGVGIWDPSGSETYNCLYHDFGEPFPTPVGADMFDFRLDNGLMVKCVDPLKTFDICYEGTNWYEGRGCRLDLRYEAFMEPHASGFPEGAEEWGANGHYEQPGRIRGALLLGDEEIAIDCWSERDRSWGPRRLSTNPRGHFPWAIANERSGFHLLAVSDADPATDPGVGTNERIITGWYLADGIYGDLASGECRVDERGDDGRPLRMSINATDHLGRELRAEGRATNVLNWNGYAWILLRMAQIEWRFDGQTAYGEEYDFWPLQQNRRFMRERSAGREVAS